MSSTLNLSTLKKNHQLNHNNDDQSLNSQKKNNELPKLVAHIK